MYGGDGINLGFEGAKRKKIVECGGQEYRFGIQMKRKYKSWLYNLPAL